MTGPSLIGTCALLGFIWVVMVLVQTPVLALGLSRPHTWEVRLLAGGWLSACTVPLLMLVVPYLPEQGWSLAWGLVEFRTTVCQPQVAAGGWSSSAPRSASLRWPPEAAWRQWRK